MKLFGKGRGQPAGHSSEKTPAGSPADGDFTGPRRSVFDLLQEKHPDLAPAGKSEPPPPRLKEPEPPKVEPPLAPTPAKVEAPVEAGEGPRAGDTPALPGGTRSEVETPEIEPPAAVFEASRAGETPALPVGEKIEEIVAPVEGPEVEGTVSRAGETPALPGGIEEIAEPFGAPEIEVPAIETLAAIPEPEPLIAIADAVAPVESFAAENPPGSAAVSPALPPSRAAEPEPLVPISTVAPEAENPPGSAGVSPALPLSRAARPEPVEPAAKRPPRFQGPRRKVALFWGGVALLFGLGAYGLAQLRPAPAPSKVAALPGDSGAEAQSVRGLDLEPEKVVVPVPGKPAADPPKADPRKADPRKPDPKKADPKKADSKKADSKKPAPPKKEKEPPVESSIVIETVPPVVPPVRTGGAQPEYPLEARSAGIEGTVVLFGVIDKNGKVKNPRVVRGLSPPLDAAALAAFRTWRFKPATQKGKKVDFKFNAGIEFRINSPAEQVAAPPEAEPAPAVAGTAPTPAPAAPAASGLLPYGGDFTPPVRVTMVWPQKPQGAQMVKGEVKLQLAVGADGSVRDVEVLEGLPQGVTEAAIEAVRQWKFKPARRSGEPVAVYHRVSLRF